MLFVILNTQTENGEIKRADQREAVSRKNWSRNGRKATQTERKPTVFVILDCRSRQCIVGGAWAKPSKAFPHKPQQLLFVQKETGGKTIDMI